MFGGLGLGLCWWLGLELGLWLGLGLVLLLGLVLGLIILGKLSMVPCKLQQLIGHAIVSGDMSRPRQLPFLYSFCEGAHDEDDSRCGWPLLYSLSDRNIDP